MTKQAERTTYLNNVVQIFDDVKAVATELGAHDALNRGMVYETATLKVVLSTDHFVVLAKDPRESVYAPVYTALSPVNELAGEVRTYQSGDWIDELRDLAAGPRHKQAQNAAEWAKVYLGNPEAVFEDAHILCVMFGKYRDYGGAIFADTYISVEVDRDASRRVIVKLRDEDSTVVYEAQLGRTTDVNASRPGRWVQHFRKCAAAARQTSAEERYKDHLRETAKFDPVDDASLFERQPTPPKARSSAVRVLEFQSDVAKEREAAERDIETLLRDGWEIISVNTAAAGSGGTYYVHTVLTLMRHAGLTSQEAQ